MWRWAGLVMVLCLSLVAHAQPGLTPVPLTPTGDMPSIDASQFPTYTALANTIVPVVDRVDIARRLFGYQIVPRSAIEPLPVGITQNFNIVDTSESATSVISAQLVAVGETAYVWIEQPVTVDIKAVDRFLLQFDTQVYPQVRALWGSESTPGIDGETRIYLVFTRAMNNEADGYFTSQNMYPADIVPGSNEHEMVVINLNNYEQMFDSPKLLSRAAHEFQHMVRHNADLNEASWMDEGFSTFTEKVLGYYTGDDEVAAFMRNPDTQLNHWSGYTSYGAALLFTSYFYERFGLAGVQLLSSEAADSLTGVDDALHALGYASVDSFFADWVLANAIQQPDSGYGYREGWQNMPAVALAGVVEQYPWTISAVGNQYATQYYELRNLTGNQLLLSLQKPDTASMLPDATPDGAIYAYGNNGDESDTYMQRAFDLTGVSAATLEYQTWFNLETLWDFAYVSVSTDGGSRWQIVPSLRTTLDNPNVRSYGAGYTGDSFGWQRDRVDLTPFVGQNILLRYEMITDDAKTNSGIAIDAISIPELGYSEDFEAGDGGWQMAGWLRSDNRLPQRAWLQVIQWVGQTPNVTRYLAQGTGDYAVDLLPNVERITLAVSPFAPLTTVPMPYTLSARLQ